ncbi:hypothetical protein P0W64_15335 [Tsukamurella sp. 8F]|uniref:hypothetical protein n=1 Tax=unclassified Tsukamurella TaxID=2633480 RepID=UPI0023B8F955|nr:MULTISPECIES: hypothetical protein [unclassified Tsukamurella]MDF0530904.1 hypothetical protein [Tsukamurella sp. 8J]MDF0588151.1 hypothetical protein [Tsukamurella sp. 8F]
MHRLPSELTDEYPADRDEWWRTACKLALKAVGAGLDDDEFVDSIRDTPLWDSYPSLDKGRDRTEYQARRAFTFADETYDPALAGGGGADQEFQREVAEFIAALEAAEDRRGMNKRCLLALAKLAQRVGKNPFTASCRELAEIDGSMSFKKMNEATHRLWKHPAALAVKVSTEYGKSNLYELDLLWRPEHGVGKSPNKGDLHSTGIMYVPLNRWDREELFRAWVWLLPPNTPVTVTDTAEAVGCSPGAARELLDNALAGTLEGDDVPINGFTPYDRLKKTRNTWWRGYRDG